MHVTVSLQSAGPFKATSGVEQPDVAGPAEGPPASAPKLEPIWVSAELISGSLPLAVAEAAPLWPDDGGEGPPLLEHYTVAVDNLRELPKLQHDSNATAQLRPSLRDKWGSIR